MIFDRFSGEVGTFTFIFLKGEIMRDLLKYGKARGIVLLNKYLPRVTPFKDVDIVGNFEEWERVKEKYAGFSAHRTDMPIGHSMKNAVPGTSGYASEIPDLIRKVNTQNPEGVVLLMVTKKPAVPRYLYDGGFNATFLVGRGMIVEFVGKAFDGHELTQGLAIHERYVIPWDDMIFVRRRCDLMRNARILKTFVCQDDYAKQRAERYDFLVNNCRYDAGLVEESLPRQSVRLNDTLLESFFDDIVFEMLRQKTELIRDGLNLFGIQGNFVDGAVQPWEIFRTERWC